MSYNSSYGSGRATYSIITGYNSSRYSFKNESYGVFRWGIDCSSGWCVSVEKPSKSSYY